MFFLCFYFALLAAFFICVLVLKDSYKFGNFYFRCILLYYYYCVLIPIRVVLELLVKGIITCLNDGVNYKYEDDVVEWF